MRPYPPVHFFAHTGTQSIPPPGRRVTSKHNYTTTRMLASWAVPSSAPLADPPTQVESSSAPPIDIGLPRLPLAGPAKLAWVYICPQPAPPQTPHKTQATHKCLPVGPCRGEAVAQGGGPHITNARASLEALGDAQACGAGGCPRERVLQELADCIRGGGGGWGGGW